MPVFRQPPPYRTPRPDSVALRIPAAGVLSANGGSVSGGTAALLVSKLLTASGGSLGDGSASLTVAAAAPPTAAAIAAALRASVRTIAFRYDRLNRAGALLGPFPNVIAASIAYDRTAAIQRTARISVREDPSVNYLSDQIKPWFRLQMADGTWLEWPLGVFLLSTPPRVAVNGVVRREIEGYDHAQILVDDRVTDRYTVAVGENYLTGTHGVATLITGAGFSAANIVPLALTLPAARDWDPGTSKLTIINDLLAAINYRAIFFDADGVPNALPYVSPAARTLDHVYQDTADSMTLPGMAENLDLFGVPNQWVLVVSEANRPPLRSLYTNSNPASPTSTVNRGRVIVRFDTNHDAADQATLDAAVARRAFEDSQVFEEVTFDTGLMPGHGDADLIAVGDATLSVDDRYSEISWSMDLLVGGRMSHKVQRVVVV